MGAFNRKGIKGLLNAHGLLHEIRSHMVLYRCPGYRALDALHHIRQFHRTVGAVGCMGCLIQGLKVIAGCGPLLPDAFFHDMDVVIQENGLDIGMQGQLFKFP